jgi:cyanophycinase
MTDRRHRSLFLYSALCALHSALLAPAAAPPPAGALVIVGGGRIPDDVRRRFVELAGGRSARLVVIPTASASADAADAARQYLPVWEKLGAAGVELLHTRRRAVADSDAFVGPLRRATGVWLSGGDQSRLTAAYRGTAVQRELRRLVARGGVVGGTSAGAAVMGEVMITGGRREATTAGGLGLLPGVLIDQHFLRRDRFDRLRHALARHPGQVGVGIDEATAVVVRGGRLSVLGESYVLVCLPDGVRVLRAGGGAYLGAWRRAAGPGK